jgi:hypothetical protein
MRTEVCVADSFPWTDEQLQAKIQIAIKQYWRTLSSQESAHATRRSTAQDAGRRRAVTGGRQMRGFCDLLAELAQTAGYEASEIRIAGGVELAGFFRPMKDWDLVIVHEDRLCAAVEFKSIASSYGNNLNDRIKESLESATDIWGAYRKRLLGTSEPFLGYVLLVGQKSPVDASTPVHIRKQPFQRLDPVFQSASYIQRAEIACRRLALERLYSASALLVTKRSTRGLYREPAADLSPARFAKQFYGHLIGCR